MFVTRAFAVKSNFVFIKELDLDPSKACITDSFEVVFINHTFVYLLQLPGRGDSNKYPQCMFS